jgi:3-dehydroquinate synthase
VIRDAALFQRIDREFPRLLQGDVDLYQDIVPCNCQIKAAVVQEDEKESGLRAILNFGHTIGHAIESLTGYEKYLHGEAVAIGMLLEAQLGAELGITPPEVVSSLDGMLRAAGYPLEKPAIGSETLIQSMYSDKKVQKGQLRFIFPTQIGDVAIHPVDQIGLIKRVWEAYS